MQDQSQGKSGEGDVVTRYRLTAPVVDGNEFWEINDMQENVNLVSISKNFPNAEERARLLYDVLTNEDNGETPVSPPCKSRR